ncbi:rCG40849 [Rattus norvegicus]|uniref:RCG40849 n=1 Tax=Rattus norvegicus TaxID=10116 RepID=A6KKZ4_RAT|nr:rCG40849 [Rattus norvegicus]
MHSHTPLIFSRTFYQVCFLPGISLWILASNLSRCRGLNCPSAISLDFSCF